MYSIVLIYRNLFALNGKIQNQFFRKLSQIQKFASYKSLLEFYLVHKNICLKFLRPILKKLEILEIWVFSKIRKWSSLKLNFLEFSHSETPYNLSNPLNCFDREFVSNQKKTHYIFCLQKLKFMY